MAEDGETLESWLNKATNPSNRQEDWEYIMGFCDQINKELEGPQISVRLLAHKIQSPQEWEAMQALTVLEACMKNCGRRFHNEVGKFKFLNELIKVVSPKYLGDRVSEKVKMKVIEMLYTWTVSLPDEAKICEAYQMLKSQGIVVVDPEVSLDATLIPSPSPRPKNPVFDDEKRSKRLAELLKSKKPEDLQEANRLIKNMVKEDEMRSQKAVKQRSTLEAVNNSVKLLNEMLDHFSPEDSTEEDRELIKELYNDCDKMRQTVFKLATETEDDDSSLGEILQASDDLAHVTSSYKKIVEGHAISGDTEVARGMQPSFKQGEVRRGRSLPSLHAPSTPPLFQESLSTAMVSASPNKATTSSSFPGSVFSTPPVSTASDSLLVKFPQPLGSMAPAALTPSLSESPALLAARQNVSLPGVFHPASSSLSHNLQDLAMLDLGSTVLPVTAYDRNGVRVLLHFATDCPPGRPDVLVMVASMLNTAPLPVRNIVLQAAVRRTMKVKLQPPSGTELAPFNPILPPAAITQIMLLANPLKEKVRMRYKLTFTLGEQPFTEVGEVNEFPPADRWGAL
uniref:Golgi associated, gamma adaptin ear containing, ARF binding protein 3 n=1 Tax=Nothobranchius furzeri TaxID=105023 RepID=A0A8C6NY47_NOTFU